MKVKEGAETLAKQFEEAINGNPAVTSSVSKQYLESVRGHYLSALAGLNTGKQEQTNILQNVGAFSALEEDDLDQMAEAEQTSIQGQLEHVETFTEMDMQIHLSKDVLGAPAKNLQAFKVRLSKTLATNDEDQISEMVSQMGAFGWEMETETSELEANRTGLSEPSGPKESLMKGVMEGSSLQSMVKSLKAQLENLKREHAELKDKGSGAELTSGNLHFKLPESKFEDESFLVNKVRETLEEAIQNQQEVEDLKIKDRGLKRGRETSKVSGEGEKRSRVALDVDEAKETTVSALGPNKSLPGRIYPACVSTSESSARMMISEDELEASSLKEDKSDMLERGKLTTVAGRADSEKYDYASEFSIRDYVFASRNRDISLNWPFSQKNLQLCLKRGVKDVLPPFQPMDFLRDSSMKRFVAETRCNSEESNLGNRPSLLKNHLVTGTTMDHQWNEELAEGYRDLDSFPSGGDKYLAFKTTATANSQSEVESVSTNNLPTSEVSDERVAAVSMVNDKMKSSASQLSDKKCQVGLKIRMSTCRGAAEDITSSCTVPSEVMTSKICPVCEAFSSSSNTTLNAHIDQCLSSQSSPTWIKNSKLIKPRVKPRKIRLMSDICATAPCCTLEDLDRRNGTNWATNADFASQNVEVVTEVKSHRVPSRNVTNNSDDGAVYIDSSGRKIRILSKFNETLSSSLPKAREDLRPEKQSKKGKTSKFFSSARKRRFAKHLKYLKANRHKKRFSSLKVNRPNEVCGTEEGTTSVRGERHVEVQELAPFAKTQEQKNAGVSGSSRQLIPSKVSNLSKKKCSPDINRHCRYELRITKERRAPNYQSNNGRIHIKKHSGTLKKCISGQQSSIRTPTSSPGADKKSETSCGKRTFGGSSLISAIQGNRNSYIMPLGSVAAQFNGTNTKEGVSKSMDSTVTPSSSHEGEVDIHADAAEYVDSLLPHTRKLLDSSHVGPYEGIRSQKSKTKTLSPSISPVHAYHSNSDRSSSPLEKSFGYRRDKKGDLWSSDRSKQSLGGHNSMMKVQKRQGLKVGDDVSKDPNRTDRLLDGSQGIYGCVNSSIMGLHDNGEVIAPPVSSSGLAIGGTVTSLSSSCDPKLRNIVDDRDPHSISLHCSDELRVPSFKNDVRTPPDEHSLRNDDHGMLYRDVVGAERLQFETGDSDLNFGCQSSFQEVDPIPIPGPPGSDLPSFSDMGSEDLHRSSSLSGSLGQSTRDGDYVVDGDLSDSHLSATSTISNMGIKDYPIVSQSLTVTLPVSDSFYPGWLGSSSEPMAGTSTSAMFSHFAVASTERFASLVDSSKESVIAQGRGPPTIKDDSQQCCCSRKEGIPWSSSVSFEESQLLGPLGKLTSSILNRRSNFLDSRDSVLPRENSHGITPVEVTPEAGASFPRGVVCDSVSPSAPILRLMGKDLMVISKEKAADLPRDQTMQNASRNSQVPSLSEHSCGFPSWQDQTSRGSDFIRPHVHEQDPRTFATQHFDFGSSNVMNNNPRSPKQVSGGMYVNKRMHSNFTIPSMPPLPR